MNDYFCEICNALAGLPHPRVKTTAIRKTELKSFSKYLILKFGRAKLNGVKILYKVSVPETNHILGKKLKLESWVEHIGESIFSGHYVLIRKRGKAFIRMSDDYFSHIYNSSILDSKLCYIAALKTL